MKDNPKNETKKKKSYGERLINSLAGCSLVFGISAIILLLIYLFVPRHGIPVVTLIAQYLCIIVSVTGFFLGIISFVSSVWNSNRTINGTISLIGVISCAFSFLYLLANS